MRIFGIGKKASREELPRAVQYIESSAEAISKINLVGGYSLSMPGLGAAIVIIVLILWKFVDAVGKALPYLVGLAALMVLLGFVVNIIESGRKEKLIERSFTQFHEVAKLAFEKYLTSQAAFTDFQWAEIMKRLDDIYLSRSLAPSAGATSAASPQFH